MLKQLITTFFVTFLATGVFGQTQTWDCGVAPDETSVKASLSDGKLTLSGSGAMQDYENGKRPWEAFKDQITKIVIVPSGNSSIMSIGDYAFSNLKNLKSVEIPEKNTKKYQLKTIGEGAFSNCSALTTVALPPSVLSIGNDAFAGCTSLTTVDIQLHQSVNNSNLESIGNSAFEGCSSLTSFGENATANQDEINIPKNVTNVGGNSFSDCSSITNVTFPNGITSVGDGAFSGCEKLTEVDNLPESDKVGNGVFSGCENLTNVGGKTVSVESLKENGFELQKKHIDGQTLSLKIIGVTEDAKGQNKFVIGSGITDISDEAFAGCTVEYLIYESNVLPSVKNNLFSDEQLAKIKLTIVSTNILEKYSEDELAKYGCNFNTTRLTITNEKYSSCTFLHNVIIPEGVAVYTAMLSEDGNSVRLTKVNNENESGYVVNSGKGVLLRAITTGSYDFVGTTGTGEEFADNILMGADTRTILTNKRQL